MTTEERLRQYFQSLFGDPDVQKAIRDRLMDEALYGPSAHELSLQDWAEGVALRMRAKMGGEK